MKGVKISLKRICPLAGRKVKNDLPVDRPVDRPTFKFLTVEPADRPPGRSRPEPESNGSLAGRSPGRPGQPESGLTSVGRPLGRPAQGAGLRARPCARRSTGPVDRLWLWSIGPVDRQSLAELNSELENWVFNYQIYPIKSLKNPQK